ncbi:MAG: alpha/beta fold hydrolase [Candidatus Aegiribacteria sp.]|nr:alpha/beta fold hydrolase [Candidatus Aegiribacteria sp.]MBD3294016.1 alpha/beta fold hydrolase [Candidatus Fermentibacteria bacterium]
MNLILVTGWATTEEIWDRVLEHLPSHMDTLVLDWRRGMNGELGMVLETVKNPVIAGWSLGGQLAMMEVAAAPASVRGLVLLSSMTSLLETENSPGVRAAVPKAIRGAIQKDRNRYMRGFFRECCASMEDSDACLLREQSKEISTESLLEGLDFMSENTAPLPSGIPAVLAHGLQDRIIPSLCSRYIHENLPGSDYVQFDGCGHMLPMEQPEAISRMILGMFTDSGCRLQ